jgi:hypothetical protein
MPILRLPGKKNKPALPADIAFSPGTRREEEGPAEQVSCLNCGFTPLDSKYCPNCGQENIPSALPLRFLLSDIGEEFLKWDGRILRTLCALLFRPGKFTREYNRGRRACYISPFRLYFVVSTLFFVVFAWKHPIEKDLRQEVEKGHINFYGPKPTKGDKKKDASSQKVAPPVLFGGAPIIPDDFKLHGKPVTPGHYLEAYDTWQHDTKPAKRHDEFKRFMARQLLKLFDDPVTFIGQLPEMVGRCVFFLLPIYALLLGMLFRGAKRYFVEHLVFAVNTHTVGFVLVLLADLLPDNLVSSRR